MAESDDPAQGSPVVLSSADDAALRALTYHWGRDFAFAVTGDKGRARAWTATRRDDGASISAPSARDLVGLLRRAVARKAWEPPPGAPRAPEEILLDSARARRPGWDIRQDGGLVSATSPDGEVTVRARSVSLLLTLTDGVVWKPRTGRNPHLPPAV